MKKILRAWPKTLFIATAATILSMVGIQAADLTRGITPRLGGLVFSTTEPGCVQGEVLWQSGATSLCVDAYEASPESGCPVADIANALDTEKNLQNTCAPKSEAGRKPWRFVAYSQAQQLCARAGKRLLTNTEWHLLVVGLPNANSCVTKSPTGDVAVTGSGKCSTPEGVHDLVGNVWEWTADTIENGIYNGRSLPESGYVDLVDASGVVVRTASTPNQSFGADYASIHNEGIRGILRGGFYQGGDDAGIFAQNMSIELDFKSAGVGFRCVRSIL